MTALGQNTVQRYKHYSNTLTKWKKTLLAKHQIELDQQYQICELFFDSEFNVVFQAKIAIEPSAKQSYAIDKLLRKKTAQAAQDNKRTKASLKYSINQVHRPAEVKRVIKGHVFLDILSYIIQELMDTDLRSIINSHQLLNEDHRQFFLYQILRGLKFIHSANIVHRNLRPRSLLVNANLDLKITGFEEANAIFNHLKLADVGSYVSNRWYRPPQDLANPNNYTKAIDIWSAGCIYAEMILKKALFKGTDIKNQYELIFQYVEPTDLQHLNIYSPGMKQIIKTKLINTAVPLKDFSQLLPDASPDAMDLLKKMLEFNPQKRITAEQALAHPYFANLHLEQDEPKSEPLKQRQFQFQQHQDLSIQELKDMIYQQILRYHFNDFNTGYQAKINNNQSIIDHIINNSNSPFIHNSDPYQL